MNFQWDNLSPIVKLGEDAEIPKEIQLLRVGTFHHPKYGKFKITKDHLLSMVNNFKNNVRGIDIAVDYSHENNKEAAAWVTRPYLKNNDTELWSEVDWTPLGSKKISSKEYRYTSSEFSLDYEDNESLKKFGPTLLGVGLTNRPAVKGMKPIIQLSEYKKGSKEMDEKDKLIENLKAEIEKLKGKINGSKEMENAKKELEEKDKKVKELSEKLDKISQENKTLKEEKETAEREKKFETMLSEGKVCTAQKEAYMANDFAKFTENAQSIKLESIGGHGGDGGKKKYDSAQDEVIALAESKAKEVKIDFDEAVDIVLSENPKLNEKYQEEVKL